MAVTGDVLKRMSVEMFQNPPFDNAEQLLDENIRGLQALSEALNDEVQGAMVDNRLTPQAQGYKEIILGITVLLPKLQRVRSIGVPPAPTRPDVCEHCE